MTPYEAIYYRKSVRTFSMAPLAPEMMDKLCNYIRHLKRLNEQIPCQVDILDLTRNKIRFVGPFRVRAPHYLMISVDKNKDGALLEAGYVAQQLVLYLTTKSIGTCYQGGLRCLNIMPAQGLKQVMLIAFGYGREKIYRHPDQARRKPLHRLCIFREAIDEDMRTLLKSARMAPSALNAQPWRFAVYGNRIHILVRESAVFPMLTAGREFDIGIVLYHLLLTAEELWMDVHLKQDELLAENRLKKCRYVVSLMNNGRSTP